MLRCCLSLFLAGAFFLSGCDTKEVDTTGPLVSTKKVEVAKKNNTKESNISDQAPEIKPEIEPISTLEIESISNLEMEPETKATDAAYKANEASQKAVTKQLEKTSEDLAKRLDKTAQEGQERLAKASSEMASSFTQADTPPKAAGCAVCHGNDGEKEAIGRSKIINQMSEQEFIDALIGYQEGTYGGPMKAMMTGQVKSLSPEDINALAKYFSAK